ncbi:hypothetical protein DERP_001838 [Dermatophagoides pteronyssinus]|uniref:Uncharacterized protein n=1 Tax=Dermatophagoides pteronyssinus TaxID=6956 RepID=A0ABQ8JBL6_DERPT|nr:hypothetical protein DERP_001838 [Dermatophagoides pteronyssinus]
MYEIHSSKTQGPTNKDAKICPATGSDTNASPISKFFATFCNNAVVEFVLNKPSARRFSPCDRQASTAANLFYVCYEE